MKKFLFALATLSSLWGIESDLPSERPLIVIEAPKKDPSFTYLSVGVTGSFPAIVGMDPFIGRRQFLADHHALDFGMGAWVSDLALVYAQGSYLYYPMAQGGPYLGAGLTYGKFLGAKELPWMNLPVTCGYQFRTKNNTPLFVQVQVSPYTLLMGSATFSLGYGF